MRYNQRVQAHILSIEYDFVDKMGGIMLDDNNWADLAGTIQLFSLIDGEVLTIYSEDQGGIYYEKCHRKTTEDPWVCTLHEVEDLEDTEDIPEEMEDIPEEEW